MISDPDIWRDAQLIMKRHGAQRADELLDQGDLAGTAVWKRIRISSAISRQ